MYKLVCMTLLLALAATIGGCGSRSPKRDNIPVLKNQLFRLQQAVKAKNRAAIDSLLAPQILEKKQSSDSLLRFVYGPTDDFAFTQFGGADIAYTRDRARIDAYIMDSTHADNRPIVLYMAEQSDMWLFTGFGPGQLASDTTADSAQSQ